MIATAEVLNESTHTMEPRLNFLADRLLSDLHADQILRMIEKIPTPSDAGSHSRGDMREGVKTRIGGSRKISEFFSGTYESPLPPLAANAQGLATESALEIATGGIVFTHGPPPRKGGKHEDEPLILHTENPTTKEMTTDYYLSDALGSITQLVLNDGTITGELAYSSFGKIVHGSGNALDQCYSYTGREFDREVDLYYYRHRNFDPNIGMFLQRDPIFDALLRYDEAKEYTKKTSLGVQIADFIFNPLAINPYAYVEGNPINYIDPFGLKTWREIWQENDEKMVNLLMVFIGYAAVTFSALAVDWKNPKFLENIEAYTGILAGLMIMTAFYIREIGLLEELFGNE